MVNEIHGHFPVFSSGGFITVLIHNIIFPLAVSIHLRNSRIPRIRAPLPAYAGDSFVNGLWKTNVCWRSRLFFPALIISYTQVPRADALYCLLSQAEPSLMVQEKQMPPSVSFVFLLDSLYHKGDVLDTPLIFICTSFIYTLLLLYPYQCANTLGSHKLIPGTKVIRIRVMIIHR